MMTGCEDAKVRIWIIPSDGLTETLTESDSYLPGKQAENAQTNGRLFMPPPPVGAGGIMFSGCPSVGRSICPSVRPSVCPSVRPETH